MVEFVDGNVRAARSPVLAPMNSRICRRLRLGSLRISSRIQTPMSLCPSNEVRSSIWSTYFPLSMYEKWDAVMGSAPLNRWGSAEIAAAKLNCSRPFSLANQ